MTEEEARSLVEPHAARIGGPIRALREIVAACGSIDDTAVRVVADVFNLSLAEVRGIVTFYDDFNRPPATHRIRICQAEACQAMGSRELTRALEARHGATLDGEVSADGTALEGVFCLGLCALAPAAERDGRLVARATPARLGLEQ